MNTLVVLPPDDDDSVCSVLDAQTSASVSRVETVAKAIQRVDDIEVACLVTAFDLPDGTGIDIVTHAREETPDLACILYTTVDPETIGTAHEQLPFAEYVDRKSADAAQRVADLVSVVTAHRTHAAYPLPDDEAARLATLDELQVDAPSLHEAFDRVTSLATGHFDVDRAAVNLLAKHAQEIVASEGLSPGSLPREETICTYTILDDGVTVIEDAAADPRFRSFERLTEMEIRFYAGAPISVDGLPVGTLCLYGDTPQTLDTDDEQYLELLAAETGHWLDTYRARGEPADPNTVVEQQ
jgi:hypothetical protein